MNVVPQENYVLILVLMEDTLGELSRAAYKDVARFVLILVLMEDTLGVNYYKC